MLQEKLPKSSSNSKPVQNDETTRLLGINLGRSDSIRNGKRNFIKIEIFFGRPTQKMSIDHFLQRCLYNANVFKNRICFGTIQVRQEIPYMVKLKVPIYGK